MEVESDTFKKEREKFETQVNELLGKKERLGIDLVKSCDKVT